MEPAVQELLNSPKLALHIRTLERVLEEERQKRQRFYDEVTEDRKAEFINGEIIMDSPARKRHHDSCLRLFKVLDLYVRIHEFGYVAHEKIMISLTRNDYEPDVCFFVIT